MSETAEEEKTENTGESSGENDHGLHTYIYTKASYVVVAVKIDETGGRDDQINRAKKEIN